VAGLHTPARVELLPLAKHPLGTATYTTSRFTVISPVRTTEFYAIVRFEVFTAVTMKNGVVWDVAPCGSCKNRRFGGT
jgi:hypothetical protein